ncbi:hypothetical protein KKF05_01195 [Patescibacteria group bacterium]|nr:hypothetical protein [Patescibacteria group bacterium]MBU1029264.1 hypothetical protein [Patescibacteria group bacterium]MBU1916341.1 hypothetical protein [Patescibacteria group bacterium]
MDPENRERSELYWEKRRLSENIIQKIVERFETGQDTMPDLITCPIQSCRYPLRVEFLTDRIELSCTNCEFRQTIKKE